MNDNTYYMEKMMIENARTWQKEAAALQLLKQAGLRQKGMLETIRELIQETKLFFYSQNGVPENKKLSPFA